MDLEAKCHLCDLLPRLPLAQKLMIWILPAYLIKMSTAAARIINNYWMGRAFKSPIATMQDPGNIVFRDLFLRFCGNSVTDWSSDVQSFSFQKIIFRNNSTINGRRPRTVFCIVYTETVQKRRWSSLRFSAQLFYISGWRAAVDLPAPFDQCFFRREAGMKGTFECSTLFIRKKWECSVQTYIVQILLKSKACFPFEPSAEVIFLETCDSSCIL